MNISKMGRMVAVFLCGAVVALSAHSTILVTGGAGFIGSHVVKALLARGDTVIVIDNFNDYYDPAIKKKRIVDLSYAARPNQLKVHRVDICDKEKLEHIFAHEKPTHICHLAAQAGVRKSVEEPEIYVQANIVGTLAILECAKKFGINHLVFASSSSVYGESERAPFCEDDAADRPCSPYAASKRSCELFCSTYHHLYGINCTCLRLFTVYGPGGRPDMAPYKFLDAVHSGKPIFQYGSGQRSRDYTYVGDVARAVVAALDKPLGFQIINVCAHQPISLTSFIATVENVVGKKAEVIVTRVPAGDVSKTFGNGSKAERLLDFTPCVSFERGLANMNEWYVTQ